MIKKSLHILPKVICVLMTILLLTSCSAERRLHRLLALHPELIKNDTVIIQDTTIIPELRIDTIVSINQLKDTIVITKEKLKVKIHQLHDTIYIEALQEPDTIIITKEIPIEKIIHKQPESITDKIWSNFRFNFLLSIFCIVLLLLVVFAKTRR